MEEHDHYHHFQITPPRTIHLLSKVQSIRLISMDILIFLEKCFVNFLLFMLILANALELASLFLAALAVPERG